MTEDYPWWRHGVVYQVYLRSFADGNGDGVGDLAGLMSRLPYLAALGIDAIWVNPWYVSPLRDGGYDVADYRDINPQFGTLDEARRLFSESDRLGIRVLVDLVPNHTSSEHAWFRAALEAPPGSHERKRYHFLPGRGEHGQLPPNNWRSVFGGPAWSRVADGEWYLHMFDVSQPDLNWANPEVRDEFIDILRFWLDLGAGGFRVDVAHAMVKEADYPDAADDSDSPLSAPHTEGHPLWDRPELHDVVREWRVVLDEYPDKVMVAEAWIPSWERLAKYVRPDEYHQTFDFEFLRAPWEAESVRAAISASITATKSVGSIPTWVLSNHDVIRHVTRYGLRKGVDMREWLLKGGEGDFDPMLGVHRARAAALLMLALPGSVYLYQGEELGLPEVNDLPEAVIEDPVWERSGHTEKGRDGCRVPLPWTPDGPSFGFGANGSWLPQPEIWAEMSAAGQEGLPGSTLELYREAISLRRDHLLGDEQLEWLDLGEDVIAFRRGGGVACVVNYGANPVRLPDGEVILASDEIELGRLPGNVAVWLRPA